LKDGIPKKIKPPAFAKKLNAFGVREQPFKGNHNRYPAKEYDGSNGFCLVHKSNLSIFKRNVKQQY
jgi:hypothetical protein